MAGNPTARPIQEGFRWTDQVDSQTLGERHLQQLRSRPRRSLHTESRPHSYRQQHRDQVFRPPRTNPRQDGVLVHRRSGLRIWPQHRHPGRRELPRRTRGTPRAGRAPIFRRAESIPSKALSATCFTTACGSRRITYGLTLGGGQINNPGRYLVCSRPSMAKPPLRGDQRALLYRESRRPIQGLGFFGHL
jgi:hypothetical protein